MNRAMSKRKISMITVDRAKTILACYGGGSSLWPEHEREAMLALLAKSSSLRLLRSEALSQDQLIAIPVDQQSEIKQHHYSKLIAQTVLSLPKQESVKQPLLLNIKNIFLGLTDKWLEQSAFINPVAISVSVLICVLTLFNPFNVSEKQSAEYLSVSEFMVLFAEDYAEVNEGFYIDSDELETLAFLEPQLFEENL